MPPKQRQVRIEQRGAQAAIEALQTKPDEELEREQKYKSAAMANRNLACTASGESYAYVNAQNAVNLCRYWIAESYAFGQCFMTPSVHQWCYTKEKGTHWYHAKPEDFADLYQFVRKNAVLFDDYEAVAQVG